MGDLKFLNNNCFVINFSEQGNEAPRKSSSRIKRGLFLLYNKIGHSTPLAKGGTKA